jgi:hypothetical protein
MQVASVKREDGREQRPAAREKMSARTYEVCELFFSRMELCGLDWGDIVLTLSGLQKENTFEGWDDWHARWVATGRGYEERAARAAAEGHRVTARQWLSRAAASYHIAEFMNFDDPEAKHHSRLQVTRIFERAIPLLGHPVHKLSIPYKGLSLPG